MHFSFVGSLQRYDGSFIILEHSSAQEPKLFILINNLSVIGNYNHRTSGRWMQAVIASGGEAAVGAQGARVLRSRPRAAGAAHARTPDPPPPDRVL